MKLSLATGDAAKAAGDLLVLPLFDSDLSSEAKYPTALAKTNKALKKLLVQTANQEHFKAKRDSRFVFHTHGKIKSARVLLLGLGARAKFDPEVLRLAAGTAAKIAGQTRSRNVTFYLPITREFDGCVKAVAEGFILGAYKFDRYRTKDRDDASAPRIDKVSLLLPDGHSVSKELKAQLDLGVRVAESTNFARNLVNEPAMVVTPSKLAEEATTLAKEHGLEIKVLGRKDIQKLNMGMFLAVAQGSVEEPKLIHVTYTPADAAAAKEKPLVFIGKAITFDSGGLSLKTADGMVDMKTDMAGSAAVLGAMRVVSQLKPPFPVHALMGACENMPSGTAYRPGDVLTSRLGKTVEITNTDAEGRLVLGDMLTYASEMKPYAMIDLATLTGACMVALGHYITGAWGDDDQTVWSVLEAARSAGEEVWRMPLTDLNKDALKSDIADMKNAGERWGGAINAALFLKEFVVDTPWVHLDIAGPSQSPKVRGYYERGATGVGVRTLVEFVRRRVQELESGAEIAA